LRRQEKPVTQFESHSECACAKFPTSSSISIRSVPSSKGSDSGSVGAIQITRQAKSRTKLRDSDESGRERAVLVGREREKEGGERQSGSSTPHSCQHNRASSQANTCCRARDANQPLASPPDHSFTTDTTGYRYIVAVTDRESRPASHKHLSRPQCQPANWPTRLSDQPRWSRSTQSRSIGRVLVS